VQKILVNIDLVDDKKWIIENKGYFLFLNEQVEEIIECKFDFIGPFKNGRAVVKLDGRLEIIDTEGAVITEGNHSGS
jgi:hypothetical protein